MYKRRLARWHVRSSIPGTWRGGDDDRRQVVATKGSRALLLSAGNQA